MMRNEEVLLLRDHLIYEELWALIDEAEAYLARRSQQSGHVFHGTTEAAWAGKLHGLERPTGVSSSKFAGWCLLSLRYVRDYATGYPDK